MSYAWYPLNKVDGRCVLLAYAEMRDECQEAHIALMVSLEEFEGQEAFRDQISDLEDYDQKVQDRIEAELVDVGSSAAHDNWKGFAQFLELAFPRNVQ